MKFELGRLVTTKNVADQMSSNKEFAEFVNVSLKRYLNCDWGEMDTDDKAMNDEAVNSGDLTIHGSYSNECHSDWKIWIITEWDRSVTTILFPSEY